MLSLSCKIAGYYKDQIMEALIIIIIAIVAVVVIIITLGFIVQYNKCIKNITYR